MLRTSLLLLGCTVCTTAPAQVTPDPIFANGLEGPNSFFEPFRWQGNHASTITYSNSQGDVDHVGTTVWWNEEAWEVQGDTSYSAMSLPVFDPPVGAATGYHMDIHKALSADPANGNEENGVSIVGGDGSPGIGVMRLDFQGVSSSRLRNVLLIAENDPGVVEFYAPKFVTTAHWWEISLAPANQVTGGENTAVPSQVARRPFEDSYNFVNIGHDDVPCLTGWHATFDVHRSVAGVETDALMDLPNISDYPVIDPTQKQQLIHWRLEFRPSGTELFADLNEDGVSEHVYHYAVSIPWTEVQVQLLGVAYQADHHPQDPACFQGMNRELTWRDVLIQPLKYARSSVAPKNTLLINVLRQNGWMGFDTRDIQRVGPPVNGAPQANSAHYSTYGDMAFASINLGAFGGLPPVSEVTLPVELSFDQARAAIARLVYDIKGHGSANLYVNGTLLGALPNITSIAYFAELAATDNLLAEWGHRSRDIPLNLLHAGSNSIRIVMTGEIVMDRLQVEFMHQN